jgi:hypothetical protein
MVLKLSLLYTERDVENISQGSSDHSYDEGTSWEGKISIKGVTFDDAEGN